MPAKNRRFWLFSVLASLALIMAPRSAAAPPPQAASPTLPPNRVEIFQDVNVRAGPGTYYDQVGVLVPGQTSPILGRNPEGTWFKIEYIGGPNNEGWVFRDLVHVVGDAGSMPTIVPPPTPTLHPTTTPLPGATQGVAPVGTGSPVASRLPTFTAPAPVVLPTLLPAQGLREGGAFPPAVLIIVLLVLGTFGSLMSLLRLRR